MVCFRYTILNTLHKGDNKVDDDDDDNNNNSSSSNNNKNNNNSDQPEHEFNLSSVKNCVLVLEKIYYVSITKTI